MATPTVYTPKKLANPTQLQTTLGTLYTVPASTTTKLTGVILSSNATGAVAASIFLVPSGGSAGTTNNVIYAQSMPTDGAPLVYSFGNEEIYLSTGDFICGTASVGSQVVVHLSGVELG